MIPFQAMVASVPPGAQRGAFNAVNSSIQQLAGGLASIIAGHIVSMSPEGRLLHFDTVGYVVAGMSLVAAFMLWRLQASTPPAELNPAMAAPPR